MDQDFINIHLKDDTSIDPIGKIIDEIEKARFFNNNEIGMTHPINSSTIKFRDNGCVDIFVSTNQGIRIDPKTQSVNIFANNEKHTVNKLTVWADEDININSKKQLILNAAELLISISNKITVNCNSIDVITERNNVTIGGISMKDMDSRSTKIEDDLSTTNNNLQNTNNNLSNTNNQLTQLQNNTDNRINALWNALNNLVSGG